MTPGFIESAYRHPFAWKYILSARNPKTRNMESTTWDRSWPLAIGGWRSCKTELSLNELSTNCLNFTPLEPMETKTYEKINQNRERKAGLQDEKDPSETTPAMLVFKIHTSVLTGFVHCFKPNKFSRTMCAV